MKRILRLVLICAFISAIALAQAPAPSGPVDPATRDSAAFLARAIQHPRLPDHDKDIDRLLSTMTSQEKIGQMTQLDIGMISDGMDQALRINPTKLDKALVQYGGGAILKVR